MYEYEGEFAICGPNSPRFLPKDNPLVPQTKSSNPSEEEKRRVEKKRIESLRCFNLPSLVSSEELFTGNGYFGCEASHSNEGKLQACSKLNNLFQSPVYTEASLHALGSGALSKKRATKRHPTQWICWSKQKLLS